MEPLRDGSYTIYKVIASLYIIGGLTLIILFEFIIKLNFNVFRIPLSKNEKLGKIFYFIVYEDKIKNIDVSDFKNPKVLMEIEETKKTRTLFKHLFGKIKDFSAIEKK